MLVWLALFAALCSFVAAQFTCTGGSVSFVAHADDDLYFQSPDLLTATKGCYLGVYMTSGDAGLGSDYWLGREDGAKASSAYMTGASNDWTETTITLAGNQVTLQTLTANPNVQKVWFRLPDGNLDGSGFSSTGYTSMQMLYTGSIASISAIDGSATWTLTTLKLAMGQIMAQRKPSNIPTLDYLSDYSAGDHSDHLTTARLTASLVGTYASGASNPGYMGYPIENLPNTMKTTDATFQAKNNAFGAYAPYDFNVCPSYQSCLTAGGSGPREAAWLLRQYVVTAALATHTGITPSTGGNGSTTPPAFTSADDLALQATASASSAGDGQPASAAIDGLYGGYTPAVPANYTQEWASNGQGVDAFIKLTWPTSIFINTVVLYDRPNMNDNVQSGTLTFDDGTQVKVGTLNNDGSGYAVSIPGGTQTTTLLFTVNSVSSSTYNVGLSEIVVLGDGSNLPTPASTSSYPSPPSATASATATASPSSVPVPLYPFSSDLGLLAVASASSFADGQPPSAAIDGNINGYPGNYSAEWSSAGGQVGEYLQLTWQNPIVASWIILYDRPNLNDNVMSGTVTLSDGTTFQVGQLPNNGTTGYAINVPDITTTSLLFTVTGVSSTTENIGLAELVVLGPPTTGTTLTPSDTSTAPYANATMPVYNNYTVTYTGTVTAAVNATATPYLNASSYSTAMPNMTASATPVYSSSLANATATPTSGMNVTASSTVSLNATIPTSAPASINATATRSSSAYTNSTATSVVVQNATSTQLAASSSVVANSTATSTVLQNATSTQIAASTSARVNSTASIAASSTAAMNASTSSVAPAASTSVKLNSTTPVVPSSTAVLNATSSVIPTASSTSAPAKANSTSSSATSSSSAPAVVNSTSSIVPAATTSSAPAVVNSTSSSAPAAASTSTTAKVNSTSSVVPVASTSSVPAKVNSTSSVPAATSTTVNSTTPVVASSTPSSTKASSAPASSTPASSPAPSSTPASSTKASSVPPSSTPSSTVASTSPTSAPAASSSSKPAASSSSSAPAGPATLSTTPYRSTNVPAGNLARKATASASSSARGSPAKAVIDGVAAGYMPTPPSLDGNEWTANMQTTGAYVQLKWLLPQRISSCIFWDRPNLSDQVTSATITLSNGQIYYIGALTNDGTGDVLNFPSAQTVTSLRFTVTGVSGTTQNSGLAEISCS